MNKSKIKLTYFNLKGLCEGIRYILAFAEADFEDIRIERKDWPNVKDSEYKINHDKKNYGYVLNHTEIISY